VNPVQRGQNSWTECRGSVACVGSADVSAYRSSRAHGFAPSVMHFPVKSGDLCQKLSDRMSEGCLRRVRASSVPAERGGAYHSRYAPGHVCDI
jgi:hypothetical protein